MPVGVTRAARLASLYLRRRPDLAGAVALALHRHRDDPARLAAELARLTGSPPEDGPPPGLCPSRRRLAEEFWPLCRSATKPYRERWPHLADEIDGHASLELVRLVARLKTGYEPVLPRLVRARSKGAAVDVARRESKHRHEPLPVEDPDPCPE